MSDINAALGGVIIGTFTGFLTLATVLSSETITLAHWGYLWGVTHYGVTVVFLAVASITFIVQCVYAWRLWIISLQRNFWLPSLIAFLAVITYCGVFYYLDIKLRTRQVKTYFKAVFTLRRRLRAIIIRTVECNLWSLFAQVGIAVLSMRTGGFYFLIFGATIGKVYTFSLIVSLNARPNDESSESSYRNPAQESEVESLPLSVILREARTEPDLTPKSLDSVAQEPPFLYPVCRGGVQIETIRLRGKGFWRSLIRNAGH
ncbi:hypothetical protein K435DRAFT_805158 [Dendrothele bispora CBS 962.96]|uniref:Uncharacterized protein n=1 Tax=Dendrothele bispora (strain CBS 962.96) TaxID=1314807 RepID=A0A4S8LBW7_DENBC|nr:hypothetical protein K435DRAFT_805158 [Dendrothele bispora CBS 962.96]